MGQKVEQLADTAEHEINSNRLIALGLAAASLITAAGYVNFVAHPDTLAHGTDTCSDNGHDMVMIGDTSKFLGIAGKSDVRGALNDIPFLHPADDNWTWSTLAGKETKRQGYDISAASLARANSSITVFSGKGNPENDIAYEGKACLTLPGPDVPGVIRVDGQTTAETYATDYYLSLKTLQSLNPGMTGKPDQILGTGEILKVAKHPSMDLFKRESTEGNIYALDHQNQALGNKISDANPTITHAGKGITKGTHAFLPPVAPSDKTVTIPGIRAEYLPSYEAINHAQTIVPKDTKPVTAELDYSALTAFQLEKYGVPAEYAAMYALYAKKYGVSAPLLAAMGKQESGWQADPGTSSTGATGISQFEPDTWLEWKKRLNFPDNATPMDPHYAIEAQAALMQSLINQIQPYVGDYSAEQLALAAYNLGFDGSVKKYNGMPPPNVIKNYVINIEAMKSDMDNYFATFKPTPASHKTTTGQIVPEIIDGFTYFSQTDNRWAYKDYSTNGQQGFNIGENGCAPTTEAAILSTLGGRRFTPADMALYNKLHGFVIPDSQNGGTWGDAAARQLATDFGYKWTNVPKSLQAIKKILDAHGVVMLNGQDTDPNTPATSGGHVYFIRSETSDGRLKINDPASISNSRRAWLASQILKPANYLIGITPGNTKSKNN